MHRITTRSSYSSSYSLVEDLSRHVRQLQSRLHRLRRQLTEGCSPRLRVRLEAERQTVEDRLAALRTLLSADGNAGRGGMAPVSSRALLREQLRRSLVEAA
jgi:hypothetical protein